MNPNINTKKTPQLISKPLVSLFIVPIIFVLYNFVQVLLS